MEDKSIGELWREYQQGASIAGYVVCDLIRKLVEERTGKHFPVIEQSADFGELISWDMAKAVAKALRDFGIDPKEYNGTLPEAGCEPRRTNG